MDNTIKIEITAALLSEFAELLNERFRASATIVYFESMGEVRITWFYPPDGYTRALWLRIVDGCVTLNELNLDMVYTSSDDGDMLDLFKCELSNPLVFDKLCGFIERWFGEDTS